MFYVSRIYVLPERVLGKYPPPPESLSNTNGEAILKELELQELPKEFHSLFGDKNQLLGLGKSSVKFGLLDTNTPIKEVISPLGKSTFTIVLKTEVKSNSINPYYFDNLILSGSGQDRVQYIARYQPSLTWLNSTTRDFSTYSGKITFYDLDGSMINSIELEANVTKLNVHLNKVQCHLEIKSTKIICAHVIDDDGRPMGEPNCLTTLVYGFKCTIGGGPTGGGEEPTEPRQVDGSWSPPTLPTEILDPCGQMQQLASNSSFKTKMTELKNKVNDNFESGYLIQKDGNLFSYVDIPGDAHTAEIAPPTNVNNIFGFIHNHYEGSGVLSTFLGSDVRTIYLLYLNGQVYDLKTFTAGVTTYFGTSYTMKLMIPQHF